MMPLDDLWYLLLHAVTGSICLWVPLHLPAANFIVHLNCLQLKHVYYNEVSNY